MNNFKSFTKKTVDNSTGLLFMQVYNRWHTQVKNELKEYEITHPQFVVMASIGYLLQTEKEITQIMISTISEIDVMSVSQILKLLEKKGLIIKKAHTSDTRANAISLTTYGSDKLKETLPVVESVDTLFFSKLNNSEEDFINLLKKLND